MHRDTTASLAVRAVLFDMDGTLVDSEGLTQRAVVEGLGRLGPALGDFSVFHGVTWQSVARSLRTKFPDATDLPDADTLEARFNALLVQPGPDPVPGAVRAVKAAAAAHRVGLVTSSGATSATTVLGQLGLEGTLALRICAEDVTRSKPDPEGYTLAASRLGVPPSQCLVFEDSLAGLAAATSAGMRAVAITRGKSVNALAAAAALTPWCIRDFTALPPHFFQRAAAGDVTLE